METVRLVEYRKEHAEWIFENGLREGDLSKLSLEELRICAKDWREKGPAWSLLQGKKVVGCGGVILQEWQKGTAWLLLSELFYSHVRIAYKTVKEKLQETVVRYRLRRVDLFVDASHPVAVRFAEHLGFELEGYLKSFGPNGEGYFILARIY